MRLAVSVVPTDGRGLIAPPAFSDTVGPSLSPAARSASVQSETEGDIFLKSMRDTRDRFSLF